MFRRSCAVVAVSVVFATGSAMGAEIDSQEIFPFQDKHVHSSSVIECPNGGLFAVWFHGSGERSADDVKIQGAWRGKGESKWGPVFTVADTPDIPDCNPVLFLDDQERLWLIWIVVHTNRWERSILKYMRADSFPDAGPPRWSWQDIVLLKPGEDFAENLRKGFDKLKLSEGMWAEYALPYSRLLVEAAADPIKRQAGWMTRTRPLVLPSGRYLLPLYSDGFNASLTAYSDDQGLTWQCGKPMVGLAPIQPSIARRKNGELVALCRDSGDAPGRILMSVSKDDGESWSVARDTELPNPGSSLAVLTLRDGRWVLVYNDTENGRHQLLAALSDDEGRTWSSKRYLDKTDAGKGSYSYPTAVQTDDGRIHVSYSVREAEGATIRHASFESAWITQR